MRRLYRYDQTAGKLVELTEERDYQPRVYVQGDGMPAAVHHADGRVYDSKSKFRRVTRDHGYVEVGNDFVGAKSRPKVDKIDWRAAVADTMRRG